MSAASAKPRTVSRQVLADHVYQEILASLMDGTLEAGASVSIDGLARDLDVSPTPIREALARLESTGLVRRVALKGYSVAPLFTSDELELYSALERSISDLRAAPRGASFAEFRDYWEADERFHRLIAENAGNQFILSAYESLGGQIQRFRFFGGLGVTDADFAIEEHSAILEAFAAADPERARDAMVSHLEGVKARAIDDVAHQA
jgi:DNA-binding GntR family transcriptional regulator